MVDIKIGYSRGFKFNGRSPVLSVVEDEIKAEQRANGLKLKDFEEAERASSSTIRRWMNGKTRRPGFDKVAGVLDLLGLEIVVRKAK